MRWYPILSIANADLRRYLWLSFPIMIGFSIVVVDEWIVKNQASYLAAGALSELQYGRTLMKVPIGVFGMAAGVAAYPTIKSILPKAPAAGSTIGVYCSEGPMNLRRYWRSPPRILEHSKACRAGCRPFETIFLTIRTEGRSVLAK